MPIDPFFTSAPIRSATARAEEKADPELLKLRDGERGRKIAELKRRKDNGEHLSEGEWWFLVATRASFKKKRQVGRREVALKIKIRYQQRHPVIYGGFNTQ